MKLSLALSFALVVFMNPSVSDAAQCRNDSRLQQIDSSQSVRIRELMCQLDRDPATLLRIQFQRLGETAAGVLLNNGKAPWTQRLYGKVKVFENPVLKEYRTLVQRFGAVARYNGPPGEGAGVGLGVDGPNQPERKELSNSAKPVRTGTVETVELPLHVEGPLIDEIMHILKQPTWPSGLNLSYGGDDIRTGQDSLFDGLTAWRYLTRSDIDQMETRLKRYNALVTPEGREWRSMRNRRVAKSIELLRYITAGGLPEKFRYFSSPVSGDACLAINFAASTIIFDVDIAVLHNPSQKALTVDNLIGQQADLASLRPVSQGNNAVSSATPLAAPALMLQPGETLIIPLRLNFRPYESSYTASAEARANKSREMANAQRRYQMIQASKAGTRFQLLVSTDIRNDQRRGKEQDTYYITKTRESFTPHSEPEEMAHAFGPEWSLTAIGISGETLKLDRPQRDGISFTVDGGAGSCPILYAWSEHERRWERHGKIIDAASSRAKSQTEIIRFDGWVPRFKIAEEELEVARIEKAQAVIQLRDGSIRDLRPARSDNRRKSGSTSIVLYSGEDAVFDFSLPKGVTVEQVSETRLIVSGYYDRYSVLLTKRMKKAMTLSQNRVAPGGN